MLMRRFQRATVLVCAVVALLVLARDPVALRAQNGVGLGSLPPQAQGPWQGKAGVSESVGAIMARERARPKDSNPRLR